MNTRTKLSIYILVTIGLTVLSLTVRGQNVIDDYGTKPSTPERRTAVVKFHVALELVNGTYYTPEQKEVMLKAVTDPASVGETPVVLFKPMDAANIFGRIGNVDISKFRTVYKLESRADKRLMYKSYDKAGRAQVMRGWFAYLLTTRSFTSQQIDFILKQSAFLNTQDLSQLDAQIEEGKAYFSKAELAEIFENVGPYKTLGVFCKQQSGPSAIASGGNCVCSIDHTNFSCNDSCSGGSGCTTTDGGCSWLWLANCTGSCSLSDALEMLLSDSLEMQ
jgi:hypothetical protein